MSDKVSAPVLVLISDDNGDGVADLSTVVEPALAAASSFADTFLDDYLPILVVPDVLRDAVISIAAQYIRLPRDKGTDDSKLAYDNAVKWLTLVSTGTAVLPGAPGASTEDPGSPEIEAAERVWTRSTGSRVF
jgi:phage gp36-like protein